LFQAFAIIIIIIESMSSKQENIKLAPNHQNAASLTVELGFGQKFKPDPRVDVRPG
jgi:hypothetical protein